jgi:hypothetical protein
VPGGFQARGLVRIQGGTRHEHAALHGTGRGSRPIYRDASHEMNPAQGFRDGKDYQFTAAAGNEFRAAVPVSQ